MGLDYLVESSGRKGFHVWVPTAYMPAATLYRLGRGVRAELGFDALEVFPKQTEVRKLGNLVKLPGGVHRVTGKPNDFIGPTSAFNAPDDVVALADQYPEVGVRSRTAAEGSVEYPCVAHIQDGVHEGGRNIHLFHLAVMLRKFSLADEHVEYIVRAANDKSDPPLEETELLQILENSQFSGPVCGQLGDDAHCGEQCMLTRHAGLYTRAGALKYAQDEENVVVTVESRSEEGRLVELSHPDMVQGRVTLSEPKRRKSDG